MILSPAYSRIAVRPFPLTVQMQKIIQEATAAFKLGVESVTNDSGQTQFTLYRGKVLVRKNKVSLTILWSMERVSEEEFLGELHVGGPPTKQATIILSCGRNVVCCQYLRSGRIYRDFQMTLNHELVHLNDPKIWSKKVFKKMPEYPGHHEDYEVYVKHPTEKSAIQGSLYYYFHNEASRGIPLKDAIDYFLQGAFDSSYRDIIKKSGKKGWQEYLTRIYKSAEQAYQDVGEVPE